LPFFGQNCSLPFSLRSLDIPDLLKSWQKHQGLEVYQNGDLIHSLHALADQAIFHKLTTENLVWKKLGEHWQITEFHNIVFLFHVFWL
jgi:hypothetical protein